jgi:hypothetical protein
MCGSNAAREAMPMHIMLSSDAKEEVNFTVNDSWIIDLHKPKTFPSSVTINKKGEMVARVLQQMLYPDVDDVQGK